MEFQVLTANQHRNIHMQKLLELEAEYVKLELDVRLAESSGVVNDQTEQAKHHLRVLETQHAELLSLLTPPPAEDDKKDALTIEPVEEADAA